MSTCSRKPAWKLALFAALPVWGYLTIDTIVFLKTLAALLPPYLHAPGFLVWMVIWTTREDIHAPDFVMMSVLNAIIYYVIILALIVVWRKLRGRHRGAPAS